MDCTKGQCYSNKLVYFSHLPAKNLRKTFFYSRCCKLSGRNRVLQCSQCSLYSIIVSKETKIRNALRETRSLQIASLVNGIPIQRSELAQHQHRYHHSHFLNQFSVHFIFILLCLRHDLSSVVQTEVSTTWSIPSLFALCLYSSVAVTQICT